MSDHANQSQKQRTIAHLSDLHLGSSPRRLAAAQALCEAMIRGRVDHVIVTGDLTDRGRRTEYEQFNQLFGSLWADGRITVVPGNHDRLGDEVAREMMDGVRVDVVRRDGLFIVRIDTTGPHNRYLLLAHGKLDKLILDEAERLTAQADEHDLVVVALHHHLLPLPEEYLAEKVASFFRLPLAAELNLGRRLIERLHGRCDLVLHGHRHIPKEVRFHHDARPLGIYNAGSSTGLGRFRLFRHEAGRLIDEPVWVNAFEGRKPAFVPIIP